MSPHDGLTVVVPVGYDKNQVPGLVESRREWICKVQQSFDSRRAACGTIPDGMFPENIDLPAIGESWRVTYLKDGGKTVTVREHGAGALLLTGDIHDHLKCRDALVRWLKRQATASLVPALHRLASDHGFRISKVSLRKQRSRWGSCSSNGTISLNLKLLFLPAALARYIMLHELCHTRHMNHSNHFWALVCRHDPGYLRHDREMRHAWRYVPRWAAVND
jgi:hypothetical protein